MTAGRKLSASSSESLNTQTHEYSLANGIIRMALAHVHLSRCKWPSTCKAHKASQRFYGAF